MLNGERSKLKDNIYEQVLFLLQPRHGPDIFLTIDNVVVQWRGAHWQPQSHPSNIPERISTGH